MHVHPLEWVVTLALTAGVLLFDVAVMARRSGEPKMRATAAALGGYVGLAMGFGVWTWLVHGRRFALEFFAGWLTEYSLSIDNLFAFVVLMTGFNVPRVYQRQALFVGIVVALILRGVFIAVGAAAIQRFSWVFYVFGVFLVYTAVRLARGTAHQADTDSAAVRFVRNHLPVTDSWHGLKVFVTEGSQRLMTPMALVIVALGAADMLFALDSIPAIYGLTKQAYLVLAANVFALMGLRQLYFLLDGLLSRLVYLSKGLGVILAFIGVKLILHALRENQLPFVNAGKHVDVPEISTPLSLAVIAATLAVAAAASLWTSRDVG